MKYKHQFLVLLTIVFGGCSSKYATNDTGLTKTKILVKYTWQINEVLRNISGKNTRYLKNGVNNTRTNYNLVRLTFNEDGSASYTNDLGQTYPATWKFTSHDQQNMELSINNSPVTYTWNFVEISDKSFSTTTAITSDGDDVLVVARFVPFP